MEVVAFKRSWTRSEFKKGSTGQVEATAASLDNKKPSANN